MLPIIFGGIALLPVEITGGWMVKDWKDGAEIARLNSDNAILEASNTKSATDIASVRQSLSTLANAIEDRAKAAEAAMVEAKPKVEKHTRAAAVIMQLPSAPRSTMRRHYLGADRVHREAESGE